MTTHKTALIDGDILAYQITYKCQALKKTTVDGVAIETPVISRSPEQALDIIASAIAQIKNDLGTKENPEIYLTGKGNFREKDATILRYKGNRDPNAKPIALPLVRGILEQEFGATVVQGMEADDMLAIRATEEDYNTIIASIDKDLLQIPCHHYYWGTKSQKAVITHKVTPEQGLHSFMKQILTGDSTDHIPGLKGLGKVKSAKLLADLVGASTESYLERIIEAYHTKECVLTLRTPEKTGMTYDIASGMVGYEGYDHTIYSVSVETIVNEIAGLLYMRRTRESIGQPWSMYSA